MPHLDKIEELHNKINKICRKLVKEEKKLVESSFVAEATQGTKKVNGAEQNVQRRRKKN
jgi:hypothetical protein